MTISARAGRAFALLALASTTLFTPASAETIFVSGMEEFLWLEGRAGIDVPLALAKIDLHTGPSISTTQADSEGRFRIRVPHDGDVPVVLRAYGVGAQSHIAFSSMPDTSMRLRVRAAGDRTLIATEDAYLNLSAFTTAMQVVVGEPLSEVADSSAFDAAALHWNRTTAEGIASLVFAVSNAGRPLPAPFTHTLEMLESGSSARSAASELPQAGTAEYYQLAQDARAEFDQIDTAPLPSIESALPLLAEPLNASGYPLFFFEADGNARVLGSGYADGLASWNSDGSGWTVQANSTAGFTQYQNSTVANPPDDDPDLGFVLVWESCKVDGYKLRRNSAPADGLLVSLRAHHHCHYPAHPSLGERDFWSHAEWPGPVLIDQIPGKAFNSVAGQSLLLPGQTGAGEAADWLPDDPANLFFLDVHRFLANGTGRQDRLGRDFQWTLDSLGRLELEYSDGSRALIILSGNPGDHDVGYVTTRLGDGRSFQTRGPILESSDPGSEFPPISDEIRLYPQAEYASGFYLFYEMANYESNFLYRLSPDGSGFRNTSELTWTEDAGRLRLDVLHNPIPYNGGVPHPIRQRVGWELVIQRGDMLYLMVNRSATTLPANAPAIDFGRPALSLVKYRLQTVE